MGEMKSDALDKLRADNPGAREQDLRLYVDAWVDYTTAQANIDEHGTVVFHPKTGSPIDNPYIKTRAAAAAAMSKHKRLRTDSLWQ